ncbi:hypothetical protein [Salarchaeum sp. JOR-1]|uniref:hypothetical protein n=1 Tax=Salarchaeum sp. JOR-1 TaxID=2599399 RepID=UPI001198487F|nr:hypothetical protein [Salarchaeum sp. JOR-1]QDX39846.1 hypothetical protein FQU85_02630 [Salarchaeum sp. JOR-1]
MQNPLDEYETTEALTYGLSGLGAANVGVTELTGTNYIADLVGTGNMELAALAFGAGGVALVAQKLGVAEVWED